MRRCVGRASDAVRNPITPGSATLPFRHELVDPLPRKHERNRDLLGHLGIGRRFFKFGVASDEGTKYFVALDNDDPGQLSGRSAGGRPRRGAAGKRPTRSLQSPTAMLKTAVYALARTLVIGSLPFSLSSSTAFTVSVDDLCSARRFSLGWSAFAIAHC